MAHGDSPVVVPGTGRILNPFLMFLERISQEIEEDQLQSLKFLLLDRIPKGTLEKCGTARKLFERMMQKGLLKENKLDALVQLLTGAQRSDLAECVGVFQQQTTARMEAECELPGEEMVCFSFVVPREHFNIEATTDSLLVSMSSALCVDCGECRFVRHQEDADNWFNLIFGVPKKKKLLDTLRNDAIQKAPWLAHCGVKVVRIGEESEIHMQMSITRSLSTSLRADITCAQGMLPVATCERDDKKLDMIVVVDCATSNSAIMGQLKTQLIHMVNVVSRKGLHFRLALISYQNHLLRMRKGHWHNNSTAFLENFTDDKAKMKEHIESLRCFGNKGSRKGLADGLNLAVRLSNSVDGDDSKCRKEAVKVCILLPLQVQTRTLDIFKCTHGHDAMERCKQLAENSVTLYTVMRRTLTVRSVYLPDSPHIDLMAEFFTGMSVMTGGQFIHTQNFKLVSEIIVYVIEEDISIERLFGTAHDIVINEIKKPDNGGVNLEELRIKLEEALNQRFCHVNLITVNGATIGPSSKSAKKFSLDDCIDSACTTFESELQKIKQSITNEPGTPRDVDMEEAASPQVSLSPDCEISSEVSERMVRKVVLRREQYRPR